MSGHEDLDRRLADQSGRDAVANELSRAPLVEAARLAAAVVESKRRTKRREPFSGPPIWSTVKAALRARLTAIDEEADARSVGELVGALWALDRTRESVTAILEAAFVLGDAPGVVPRDLGHDVHRALPTSSIVRLLDQAVRGASHDVLVERVETLLPCLLRTDLLAAASGLAAIGWAERELGRLATALCEAKTLTPIFDGERLRSEAAWLLRALLATVPAGAGRDSLEAWLSPVEPSGPRLPHRLPLTLDELRPFASLLGATFDEGDPARIALDRYGSHLEETLARHLTETDHVQPPLAGKQVDVRRFLPFAGVEVLGTDATGDTLFLDPRRRTRAGTPPIVRYCHDQLLTAELEANGECELAARAILARWASARSCLTRPDISALLGTPVVLEAEGASS